MTGRTGYIDLHRHLEGSITPFVAAKLGCDFDTRWRRDREGFFEYWMRVLRFVSSPEMLADIAYFSVQELSRVGLLYVEYQISPAEFPFDQEGLVRGVAAALEQGRKDFGVPANLIMNVTRHFPERVADDVDAAITLHEAGLICGIGLAGNEPEFRITTIAGGLSRLAEADVPLSVHAGEFCDHTEIEAALELGARRIGHGNNLFGSASLPSRLKAQGVGLEVCISSEISLGNVESLSCHPIRQMKREGLLFNLNTDDPAVFRTEIDREYALAASVADIDLINSNAIQMAFCDEATRQELRRLTASRATTDTSAAHRKMVGPSSPAG